MEKSFDIVDEILSPASKWVNREVFGNRDGKSVCQSIEDATGIPKIVTEISAGVLLFAAFKNLQNSRN